MGQCYLVDRTALAKPGLTNIKKKNFFVVIHSSYAPVMACPGYGQSRASTSYISICGLGELQFVRTDKLCQAKHPEDKNLESIYGQYMEILITESHMYLLDIESSPSLNGQNNNRKMSSIRLNLLTKKMLSSKPQE